MSAFTSSTASNTVQAASSAKLPFTGTKAHDKKVAIIASVLKELRERLAEKFKFKCLEDLDYYVGHSTVQLPMLLDQLRMPFERLRAEAKVTLVFVPDSKADPPARRLLGLSDLACIRDFIEHKIEKSPTDKASPEYNKWQFYTPASNVGVKLDIEIYVFLGQFPMALSAEAICDIFVMATGIMPVAVVHLPKGAKVFLRNHAEVDRAASLSQTVQVTEFGTIFARAANPIEAAASRVQLIMMRKELDLYLQCFSANRRPYRPTRNASVPSRDVPSGVVRVNNPYFLLHSHQKLRELARVSGKKKQCPEDQLIRRGKDARGEDVRNGTYPMTIETPKPSSKKPTQKSA